MLTLEHHGWPGTFYHPIHYHMNTHVFPSRISHQQHIPIVICTHRGERNSPFRKSGYLNFRSSSHLSIPGPGSGSGELAGFTSGRGAVLPAMPSGCGRRQVGHLVDSSCKRWRWPEVPVCFFGFLWFSRSGAGRLAPLVRLGFLALSEAQVWRWRGIESAASCTNTTTYSHLDWNISITWSALRGPFPPRL